jgi:hypothetical protein
MTLFSVGTLALILALSAIFSDHIRALTGIRVTASRRVFAKPRRVTHDREHAVADSVRTGVVACAQIAVVAEDPVWFGRSGAKPGFRHTKPCLMTIIKRVTNQRRAYAESVRAGVTSCAEVGVIAAFTFVSWWKDTFSSVGITASGALAGFRIGTDQIFCSCTKP